MAAFLFLGKIITFVIKSLLALCANNEFMKHVLRYSILHFTAFWKTRGN